MTLNACILIKTKPLDTDEILEKTRKLKGIRKAFLAYGRFDIISFVEAPGYSEIRDVTSTINSIQGVRSSETLVEG